MNPAAASVVPLHGSVRRHQTHQFSSLETAEFNVCAYSRMKFGSGRDARILGYEMADAFAAENWEVLTTQQCLIIPAPSTSVPVAATLLGWHFRDRLNSMLDGYGGSPVDWDQVHRAVTYNDNYSQLGLEERRRLLADDSRYVNVAYAAGKTLVFVDDVTITGTHEEKLAFMLAANGMDNPVIYATYAAYQGTYPAIEHQLNHAWVRDGLCVAELSKCPEWTPTTRALRLLLEVTPEKFAAILDSVDALRLSQVYHACISKGYSRHPAYEQNFSALRRAALSAQSMRGPAAGG